MREFLTSGQVGKIELNEQKRIRQEIRKFKFRQSSL